MSSARVSVREERRPLLAEGLGELCPVAGHACSHSVTGADTTELKCCRSTAPPSVAGALTGDGRKLLLEDLRAGAS
jgi:hypothetical protein